VNRHRFIDDLILPDGAGASVAACIALAILTMFAPSTTTCCTRIDRQDFAGYALAAAGENDHVIAG
jgi:hypothetical protein